jgi:hypothetical protein
VKIIEINILIKSSKSTMGGKNSNEKKFNKNIEKKIEKNIILITIDTNAKIIFISLESRLIIFFKNENTNKKMNRMVIKDSIFMFFI